MTERPYVLHLHKLKTINYERLLQTESGIIYVGEDGKAHIKNRNNDWEAAPKSKLLKKYYDLDKEEN